MNANSAWLVLDQGGHANRVRIFGHDGRPLAHVCRALETDRRPGVEQDPRAMANGLRECIDQAVINSGVPPGRFRAAGLACQRASVVCWERESGEPLTPVISWQDTRAADRFARLDLDAVELARITGLVPSAHYGASKLAWCLDQVPAVRRAAADGRLAMGPLAAYLLCALLVEHPLRASHTLAQRTLLYDCAAGDWSEPLLNAFGIPRPLLPDCVPDASCHGQLPVGSTSIPLTVCAGDQNVLPLAFGPPDSGAAYLNLGTGGFLLRPLAANETVPEGLLRSLLPVAAPGGHEPRPAALEATVNGAGSAFDWYAGTADLGRIDWDRLDPMQPIADAPYFINTVGGLGAPWWRSGIEPGFSGAGTTDQELYAVAESVAFLVRAGFDRLRGRRPIEKLWLSGGLSRCRLLVRLLASVLEVPVRRSLEPEMTSRGILALLAPNLAQSVPAAETVEPDFSWSRRLERRYREWTGLLQSTLEAGPCDL